LSLEVVIASAARLRRRFGSERPTVLYTVFANLETITVCITDKWKHDVAAYKTETWLKVKMELLCDCASWVAVGLWKRSFRATVLSRWTSNLPQPPFISVKYGLT